MTMIIASATIGGMNLLTSAPIVDPNRTEGMIIMTMLQSTAEVGLVGCLRKINVMKLNRAVPTVSGYVTTVAPDQVQFSKSISKRTLNYPNEFPEVLQMALAKGKMQQMRMGQRVRGKTGSWIHLLVVSQQYWQGQWFQWQ